MHANGHGLILARRAVHCRRVPQLPRSYSTCVNGVGLSPSYSRISAPSTSTAVDVKLPPQGARQLVSSMFANGGLLVLIPYARVHEIAYDYFSFWPSWRMQLGCPPAALPAPNGETNYPL
eukprot:scaffold121877_cov34-Tisochrysis_lutea.AAC.3